MRAHKTFGKRMDLALIALRCGRLDPEAHQHQEVQPDHEQIIEPRGRAFGGQPPCLPRGWQRCLPSLQQIIADRY